MDQVFSQSDKVIELIKLSNGHALGFGSWLGIVTAFKEFSFLLKVWDATLY